jgi:hypothetical protein
VNAVMCEPSAFITMVAMRPSAVWNPVAIFVPSGE